MTPAEVVKLCKVVDALKSGHPLDPETVEVWVDLLADVDEHEGAQAVKAVAARTPWLELSEILAEVHRARRRRIEAVGEASLVPNVDPNNVAAYLAEARALREHIARGRGTPEQLAAYQRGELGTRTGAPPHITAGALKKRDMRAITAPRKAN